MEPANISASEAGKSGTEETVVRSDVGHAKATRSRSYIMKFVQIAAAAALVVSFAGASLAQDSTESSTPTPNDIASAEALGMDPLLTGKTDEERLAYFSAMSADEQTTMKDNCTKYIGSEPSLTPNDIASEAAMSFCKVVVAPQ
jgi:hypothetical protein